MTPTGRLDLFRQPTFQQLPLHTATLAQYRAQMMAARRFAWEQSELDAREDEALRMFGLTVEYVHDERIIEVGQVWRYNFSRPRFV